VYTKEILSPLYHIDKKYRSMMGPDALQKMPLLDSEEPELVWIVGYQTTVMDDKGEEASPEFMCHANLDIPANRYYELFDTQASLSGRLFTLSQGQLDIAFPEGHGIPWISTETLNLTTQVLNLNIEDPDLHVRHRVRVRFVRDKELTTPMKPLYQGAVQGFKALEESARYYGVSDADPEHHGSGCAIGESAIEGDIDEDRLGQKFTAHWVVKSGREENRTLVTKFLGLNFDTTAHYIAVHLHPFAESLELIDLTADKSLFKSNVRGSEGRIGIDHVEYYTSTEGIQLFKDHDYELVSVYNNTSGEDVDSMAVMYLYMDDPTWKKPDLVVLKKKLAEEKEAAEAAPEGAVEEETKHSM